MCTKKDNSHLTRESHVPFYYITRNAFKYNNKKTKKIGTTKHNVYNTKSICTSLNNEKKNSCCLAYGLNLSTFSLFEWDCTRVSYTTI